MVSYDHQVSDFEIIVHASGSIRNKKITDTQDFHHTYGKCDKFHRVAFVIMEPALHRHYGLAPEFAAYEIALVPYGCGNGKARNLGIRYYGLILDFVSQFSQAAPQNNADQRLPSLNL